MPVLRRDEPTPYWRSECGRAMVYVGDNLAIMDRMAPDQFHAVVTDPPYGLEFMGKEWDAPWKAAGGIDAKSRRAEEMSDPVKAKYLRHNVEYVRDSALFQLWFYERAAAMLRVAKPGAHILSFGGTRMWHRMACAVEDAGWEVRDTIMWLYGSGFPKSHDVSKAIDKIHGAEREVVRTRKGTPNTGLCGGDGYSSYAKEGESFQEYGDPVTDDAKRWSGWGTALKPAVEPVVVARKSLAGSVAENVLGHGCGGINVDGCRVGTTGTDVEKYVATKTSTGSGVYAFNNGEAGEVTMNGDFVKTQKDGRWPANAVLSHHPECKIVGKTIEKGCKPSTFGDSGGEKGSFGLSETTVKKRLGQMWPGHPDREVDLYQCHQDCPVGMLGDASRFFYTAKAGDDDRPHGRGATAHPTVKPLDLMRYLVRLVCARGGTVLDPFMGSGSTGCAAIEEGMWFVGIEQSPEYADIAVGRLKLALAGQLVGDRLESGRAAAPASASAPPPARKLR